MIKIEEILKQLPHRYPFLMVDRVIGMEKGKSIVGIKNVTYNEAFFQGHFPEIKIMPGVLIIEAVAQVGGILLYHSIPDPKSKIVFLSKINNVKFRKPVIPGDQLRLEAKIIKLRSKFCVLEGKAYVDDELVAEGEMSAALLDLEELNVRK